jgi:hypothetical protein
LHAVSLLFEHPTTKERLTFSCPLSADWHRLDLELPRF